MADRGELKIEGYVKLLSNFRGSIILSISNKVAYIFNLRCNAISLRALDDANKRFIDSGECITICNVNSMLK